MKTFLFIVFCAFSVFANPDHKVVIFYEYTADGYALYANNDEEYPVTIVFDFDLLNLKVVREGPSSIVVPAETKKFKLVDLVAINVLKGYSFEYTYTLEKGAKKANLLDIIAADTIPANYEDIAKVVENDESLNRKLSKKEMRDRKMAKDVSDSPETMTATNSDNFVRTEPTQVAIAKAVKKKQRENRKKARKKRAKKSPVVVATPEPITTVKDSSIPKTKDPTIKSGIPEASIIPEVVDAKPITIKPVVVAKTAPVKPKVETTKPVIAEIDKPIVTETKQIITTKPVVVEKTEPIKPKVETSMPIITDIKPVVTTKPVIIAKTEPVKPKVETPKPVVVKIDKPIVTETKPIVTTEPVLIEKTEPIKPIVETHMPVITDIKPMVSTRPVVVAKIEPIKSKEETTKPVIVKTDKPIVIETKPLVISEPVVVEKTEPIKPKVETTKPIITKVDKPIIKETKPVVTVKPVVTAITEPVKPKVEIAEKQLEPIKSKIEYTITGKYDAAFQYHLPFRKGESYSISQGYQGSISHQTKFAIDFAMNSGTAVYSARDGVVLEVVSNNAQGCGTENCEQYDNHIVIKHSDGSYAKYGHLGANGASVKDGDAVTLGQLIGYSGNTGWTSTPALHFEVFVQKENSQKTVKTNFLTGDGSDYGILMEKRWYKKEY